MTSDPFEQDPASAQPKDPDEQDTATDDPDPDGPLSDPDPDVAPSRPVPSGPGRSGPHDPDTPEPAI